MSTDFEPAARLDDENPWPGLLSFRERDHRYFGGRDAAIEELFRRVVAEPLTLVFGPSGLGKTSLLRAGLFPRLRREHFFPVYIRLEYVSGRSPLQQIKEEIVKQAAESNVEATPPDDDESLWEYLHRRDVDFWDERNFPCTLVLVFDQFEELFTKGRKFVPDLTETLSPLTEGSRPQSVRSALAKGQSLYDRYHDQRRYRVVLSIREDYVAQLYALSDRFRSVFTNWFSVQRMTGDAALTSVTNAAKKRELVDEAVARRIVRFVGGIKNDPRDEPDPEEKLPVEKLWIEPALLSVICKELNEARKKTRAPKITMGMLAERKEAILSSFLDDSFALVPSQLAKFVEGLVLDEKTRDSIAMKKALDEGISENDIRKLVDRSVLRIQEIEGVARIELTHDLLTSEIAARRTRREALEKAREAEEAKLAAAREAQEEAERAREAARKAQEDAEKSRDAARRDLRKTQIAFTALAALFVAILSFGLYIRFVRAETRRKEARDLFRSANRAFDDKRDAEGLASLAQALRADPSNDTARTLVYDRLLRGGWWVPVSSIAIDGNLQESEILLSADGTKFLAIAENRVSLWDTSNGNRINEVTVPSEPPIAARFLDNPRFVRISTLPYSFLWDTERKTPLMAVPSGGDVRPDGQEIAAPGDDGFDFIDLATGARTHVEQRFRVVRYTPEKTLLLVTVPGDERGTFRLWNRETGKFDDRRIENFLPVRSIAFTPDGGYFIVGTIGGRVSISKIPSNQPMQLLRNAAQFVLRPIGAEIATMTGNEARIYDLNDNRERTLLHEDRVSSVAYSADGYRLLTTAEDGTVHSWDGSGNRIGAPLSHRAKNVRAQFRRDGSIVTVSDRVQVWRFIRVLDEPLIAVAGGVYPDTARSGGPLALFEEMSATNPRHLAIDLRKETKRWESSASGTASLAVSPSGKFIAFARDVSEGFLEILIANGETGKEVWSQTFANESVVTAHFANGDATLVVLSNAMSEDAKTPARIRFISTRTWKEERRLMRVASVETLAVAPAGRFLAIIDAEARATLWDWKADKRIDPPIADVAMLRFSNDGQRLIASFDKKHGVGIFETEPALRQTARIAAEDYVGFMGLSPDGRSLITSSNEVVISDMHGRRRRRPIAGSLAADPHFSEQGKRAAIVFTDYAARVCDLDTGWPVTRPIPIDGDADSLAFLSSDGQTLFVVRDRMLVRTPVPQGTRDESATLVKLAEAIAGKQVSDEDFDTVDSSVKLAELAKECAGKSDRPCRFVQWFSGGHTKTISPLSSWTWKQYAAFKPVAE